MNNNNRRHRIPLDDDEDNFVRKPGKPETSSNEVSFPKNKRKSKRAKRKARSKCAKKDKKFTILGRHHHTSASLRKPNTTPCAKFMPCRDYHIVLHFSEPTENYIETRGTAILHQVLGEIKREGGDNKPPSFDKGRVLREVTLLILDEFPSVRSSDNPIVLIECTQHVRSSYDNLVDDAFCYGFASDNKANYGPAAHPEHALECYYSVWSARIPRRVSEQRTWLSNIERDFCSWQMSDVAKYQSVEKIEILRLAIIFLKKWIGADESGLTKQVVTVHLNLVQRNWNELKSSEILENNSTADNVVSAPEWVTRPDEYTEQKELPHPLEFFQMLPTSRSAQKEYLKMIRENYDVWKGTPVAAQIRSNHLFAFEKLMHHANRWIGCTETEPVMTARTTEAFFGLLRDRWNDFMNKTRAYSGRVLQQRNGVLGHTQIEMMEEEDHDEDENSPVLFVDSTLSVASCLPNTAVLDKNCSIEDDKLSMTVHADADNESQLSEVSTPFPKQLDPNPIFSDAILDLFDAVQHEDSSRVENAFTEGAKPNSRDDFGETTLHKAAAVGNVEIAKQLLLWGEHPWNRNTAGELPIHIACYYGHLPMVKLFMERMESTKLTDMKDARGWTPFHVACYQGRQNICQWFSGILPVADLDNELDHDSLSPWYDVKMNGNSSSELDAWWAPAGANGTKDEGTFDSIGLHDARDTGHCGLIEWKLESSLSASSASSCSPLVTNKNKCTKNIVVPKGAFMGIG